MSANPSTPEANLCLSALLPAGLSMPPGSVHDRAAKKADNCPRLDQTWLARRRHQTIQATDTHHAAEAAEQGRSPTARLGRRMGAQAG
jgi:hypothetical protein